MAWTYTGDPSNSNRDAVRFLCQDTNPDDQLLQDAEIDWLITENSAGVYHAAAEAASQIATLYSRMADQSIREGNDQVSVSYSQRADQYRKTAKDLAARASKQLGSGAIYAGHTSISDVQTDRKDTDAIPPRFHKNMFKNRNAPDSKPRSDEIDGS